MRKIKLDNDLILRVDDFYNSLFSKRSEEFKKPVELLEELRGRFYKPAETAKYNYVQKIITQYPDIVRSKPSNFQKLIKEFEEIIPTENIEEDFYKSIVKAMRYEELRNKEYLEFVIASHLKTCVYCNIQSAITFPLETYKIDTGVFKKGDIKDRYATYELDHIHPKSKYPFLSTSFFNLIPSCSICNKAKSDKSITFTLYEENDVDLELFLFQIEKESRQNYWKSKNISDIEITVTYLGNEIDYQEKYEEIFKISKIYATQKDIIEELFHKQEAYVNAYVDSLTNSFKDIFPDKALINRLIIGNYDKPEDIHRRPMAKFTQDIARQLGLI